LIGSRAAEVRGVYTEGVGTRAAHPPLHLITRT
jgi:hypothetical protein